ncbi:hypothetical protein RP29_19420 [Acidovorax temperans]|uniref:Uncharacterized protein n=1 Tax=Acidovorax temperans TaxID=80878 RepID=A0A0D7K4M3_9BURK|nr:hypothetical protein RP29_19420 [Acidovorax temperans]
MLAHVGIFRVAGGQDVNRDPKVRGDVVVLLIALFLVLFELCESPRYSRRLFGLSQATTMEV